MESSRLPLPKKGILLSAGSYKEKIKILEFLPVFLKLGLPIYATQGTSNFLTEFDIPNTCLAWPGESGYDVIKAIQDGRVDLVINIPKNQKSQELTRGYEIRKTSVEHSASLLTNAEKTMAYLKALHRHEEFYQNHEPTPLAEYLER
jgi:carbamoyl-phosphate synthase large subunit